MNNYYDKREVIYTYCGHSWILLADRAIDYEIYTTWVLKILEQHKHLFPKGDIDIE